MLNDVAPIDIENKKSFNEQNAKNSNDREDRDDLALEDNVHAVVNTDDENTSAKSSTSIKREDKETQRPWSANSKYIKEHPRMMEHYARMSSILGILFFTVLSAVVCVLLLKMKPYGNKPFRENLPFYEPPGKEFPIEVLNYTYSLIFTNKSIEVLLSEATLNSLFMLAIVIGVTYLFLFLFLMKYMKLLKMFVTTSFMIGLILFPILFLIYFFQIYSIPWDAISFAIVIWNMSITGAFLLFVQYDIRGNLKNVTNFYLILVSTAAAFPFLCFPEWTLWSFLLWITVYDFFAVLTPCGPLRVILAINQERIWQGEREYSLPDMIAVEGSNRLFSLGLGDLVFFSVMFGMLFLLLSLISVFVAMIDLIELKWFIFHQKSTQCVAIGRSAMVGFITFCSTTISIIFGLVLTAYYTSVGPYSTLPALPIPLGIGIPVYFFATYILIPFIHDISLTLVNI